jgi:hypothetical protein
MYTWIITKISKHVYRLLDTSGEIIGDFKTFGNAKDFADRAGYATIFDL